MNVQTLSKEKSNQTFKILSIIAVIFIAFNLRPAITSIGPLIGLIRDDVGFSNWTVALLTSLPLIAFAMISPVAPMLANKLTNEKAVATGLFILMIGISLRSISMVFFIFVGTFLLGAGIAVCNVILPALIREKFPYKIALMTSIYTTSMAIFATLATAISVPLLEVFNGNWQLSLIVWVIPAIIGILFLIMVIRKNNKMSPKSKVEIYEQKRNGAIWKSSLAWRIAIFMGFQSLLFYVMISWLPEILIDGGMSRTMAGYMLSYLQLIGIPVSFVIPIIALKMKSQSPLVLIVNAMYLVGFVVLIFKPSLFITITIVTFAGIAQSANFALAFVFFSVRGKTAKDSAELSGMAQSIGYVLAAIGPVFVGAIFDITNVWTVPLVLLSVITLVVIVMGMSAGKNRYVLE